MQELEKIYEKLCKQEELLLKLEKKIEESQRRREEDYAIKQKEQQIKDVLYEIKIFPHYTGFKYLEEAICITVENPIVIEAVTKEIYPTVASHFKTSQPSVDRGMRTAINSAWINGGFGETCPINTLKRLGRKPTNSEFIAIVADYIAGI